MSMTMSKSIIFSVLGIEEETLVLSNFHWNASNAYYIVSLLWSVTVVYAEVWTLMSTCHVILPLSPNDVCSQMSTEYYTVIKMHYSNRDCNGYYDWRKSILKCFIHQHSFKLFHWYGNNWVHICLSSPQPASNKSRNIDLNLLHTVGFYGPCQNPFVTKVASTWCGESRHCLQSVDIR